MLIALKQSEVADGTHAVLKHGCVVVELHSNTGIANPPLCTKHRVDSKSKWIRRTINYHNNGANNPPYTGMCLCLLHHKRAQSMHAYDKPWYSIIAHYTVLLWHLQSPAFESLMFCEHIANKSSCYPQRIRRPHIHTMWLHYFWFPNCQHSMLLLTTQHATSSHLNMRMLSHCRHWSMHNRILLTPNVASCLNHCKAWIDYSKGG